MQRQEFLRASLETLKKKTGISKSRWSNYFTGINHPSGRNLNKAAETFGVSVPTLQKWIICRKENKKPGRSTCRSPSSSDMIANIDNQKQSPMKTKAKIGWVRSASAAHHLNLSTASLRKRRETEEYKEGIHYRVSNSCSLNALRVSYEYNVEEILRLRG